MGVSDVTTSEPLGLGARERDSRGGVGRGPSDRLEPASESLGCRT